jgi:hypothetical protein
VRRGDRNVGVVRKPGVMLVSARRYNQRRYGGGQAETCRASAVAKADAVRAGARLGRWSRVVTHVLMPCGLRRRRGIMHWTHVQRRRFDERYGEPDGEDRREDAGELAATHDCEYTVFRAAADPFAAKVEPKWASVRLPDDERKLGSAA